MFLVLQGGLGMNSFVPKRSPWKEKIRKKVFILTVIVFLIIAWEIYKTKRENYTELWNKVNNITYTLCKEDCRPSIGCQCGD